MKNWMKDLNIFLQRRYTNGQKAHEKMLNIMSHQRNETQNHEIHFTGCKTFFKTKKENNNFPQNIKKLEPSYIADGNVNWCSCFRKHFGVFSKNIVIKWPSNSTSRNTFKRSENRDWLKNV